MKLLVIGDKARTEKYLPDLPVVEQVSIQVVDRGTPDDEILNVASDADFIMADAVSPVSAELIASLPNLKLIHSEGVAYNAIDIDAAREHGVIVCNNAGVNAGAVAEQTILLMLMCLRDSIVADAAVRSCNQIQTKETMMVEGIRELADCKVGFIGFGAIAQATASRLANWGCEMFYNKSRPLSEEDEERFHAKFATKEDIAKECDIVSLHVPVTDSTRSLVNDEFLKMMKPDSVLINTARGEIVDQEALVRALESGTIGMAGLDTMYPEPVQTDNPLLKMSEGASKRLVLSPHIGGITEGMFYRAHKCVWENIERVINDEPVVNRVA